MIQDEDATVLLISTRGLSTLSPRNLNRVCRDKEHLGFPTEDCCYATDIHLNTVKGSTHNLLYKKGFFSKRLGSKDVFVPDTVEKSNLASGGDPSKPYLLQSTNHSQRRDFYNRSMYNREVNHASGKSKGGSSCMKQKEARSGDLGDNLTFQRVEIADPLERWNLSHIGDHINEEDCNSLACSQRRSSFDKKTGFN